MNKTIWIIGGVAAFTSAAIGGAVSTLTAQGTEQEGTLDEICAVLDSDAAYVCHEEVAPSTSAPSTTEPSPPTTEPSTTASPSTAPPTTLPPTSTVSSTTTSPPTTEPPQGTLFSEDFTNDDIEDFKATFDWSVIDLWRRNNGWQGHHDMTCGPPNTERTLHHIQPPSNTDPGEEFWLCGPMGPQSDHLMTSNGDNGTFGITSFTPKQAFDRDTARRVCWDVNLTVSRGRRLWWEVQLVNAEAVAANRSLASQGLMVGGVDFERGTAFIGYGQGMDGTMMKRPWPADSLVFDYTEERVRIWKGQNSRFFEPYDHRFVTEDRATRYQNCLIDNGDNTVTFTQERPSGVYTGTATDASFPDTFRVIFSAHNYNAGKDGTQPFQTWHWDDIGVSTTP